jgi:hypothetical protein
MRNSYQAGNLVRLTMVATNTADGSLLTPQTIDIKVKDPSGVITDLASSVVNDSPGNYHADFTPSLVGVYTYEWICSGNMTAAAIRDFYVRTATF